MPWQNVDFETREVKKDFKQLTMIRVGTSGGMATTLSCRFFCSVRKIYRFDGLLHYYEGLK